MSPPARLPAQPSCCLPACPSAHLAASLPVGPSFAANGPALTPRLPPTAPPPRSLEGSYQNQQAQLSCTACTPGTWAGAQGSDQCDATPAGAYTNTSGATVLSWCGPGTISNAAGTGCVDCPSGYWRPGGDASPNSNQCIRIPSGWRALTNTAAYSVALCTAGSVSTWSDPTNDTPYLAGDNPSGTRIPADATECSACGNNTFAAQSGSSDCTVCRAGYYPSTTDMTGVTATWTPATTTLQTNCAPCPALYYKDLTNTGPTCSPCSPGSETRFALGASTCTQCVPGYVNPSQTDAVNVLAPGAGAASYYNATPVAALGVSIGCLAW